MSQFVGPLHPVFVMQPDNKGKKAPDPRTLPAAKGGVGDALLKQAGSAEKALANVQRAVDAMKLTGSGAQTVTVNVGKTSVAVRVYIQNSIARVSTILKM